MSCVVAVRAVPLHDTVTALPALREVNGLVDNQKNTNRLIKEKSPYLLQHAYNPVQWYPWSEEAFEKALEPCYKIEVVDFDFFNFIHGY